jgi:preprotein translocase subunit SecE
MAKAATATTGKPNLIQQVKTFAQEVKVEMDKVTWPTKEDLKASTQVVLIFLAIMAILVGILDVIFQNVVLALLRIF